MTRSLQVYEKTDPITVTNEVISLEEPVWAKKIRLTVDGYNGGSNDWPNVSVAEFESYAVEPAQISEDATPKEVADLLGVPLSTKTVRHLFSRKFRKDLQ